MGVRDIVPALLLRLDRDQECYDFLKWYATTGQEGDYDWGDLDEPFLDLKDMDVLESPVLFCHKYLGLSHSVSVTLLKIKLLLAVRAGPEGWEMLRSSQTFNQIEESDTQNSTGDYEQPVELIKVLKSHVNMLYEAIDKANEHYWPALMAPGSHLEARPPFFSPGSEEEMQLQLQRSYDAWTEVPGAIEVIKAISQKKDY